MCFFSVLSSDLESVLNFASFGTHSDLFKEKSFQLYFLKKKIFHLTKYFIEEKTNAAVLNNIVVLNHKQYIYLVTHTKRISLFVQKNK